MGSPEELNAPKDHGVLLHLDEEGTSYFRFVPDIHLGKIHPNLHVPKSLNDVEVCVGGGSGALVIKGMDEMFRDVVLKHGGHKDTQELFALVVIGMQLRKRGHDLGALGAAKDMRARIPEFKYVYISQNHLRQVKKGVKKSTLAKSICVGAPAGGGPGGKYSSNGSRGNDEDDIKAARIQRVRSSHSFAYSSKNEEEAVKVIAERMKPVNVVRTSRGIRIIRDPDVDVDECVAASKDVLELHCGIYEEPLMSTEQHIEMPCEGRTDQAIASSSTGDGADYFDHLLNALCRLQSTFSWKLTLAQRAIGGDKPVIASALLLRGALEGELLSTLITHFVTVIRSLQSLTRPDEKDLVQDVRDEVKSLSNNDKATPEMVSNTADAFVGFAVKKNYRQGSGRFRVLRGYAVLLRSGSLVLTEEERGPARYLTLMLQREQVVEDVIESDLQGPMALDTVEVSWLSVLRDAVACRGTAVTAIWNSGLTDSGLHNLFLDESYLWAFDLGEPAVMPLPAFLTKFFMSFFHTLGMEETTDGGWVNRFKLPSSHADDRLQLTSETSALLAKAHSSFKEVLKVFVHTVFNGEASVCSLLIKYVVMQLLSDAAFCLEKWEVKGGGVRRTRPIHLEKWLWRSIWDLYVASYVASIDWCKEIGVKRPAIECTNCCFAPLNTILRTSA